jgi:hypothetical protein
MREILGDIVHQSASLFEVIKITGTDELTKIQAVDKDKTLFLQGSLKTPIEEFKGEFGIGNLSLLSGLLIFASYRADGATFKVKREVKSNAETVTQLQFRDVNGTGSNFKTMAAHLVGEQAVVTNIPWNVQVTPNKARTAEFAQLAGLYGEVDKTFGVQTINGALVLSIGDANDSTHSANLMYAADVDGELKGDLSFDTSKFLSILKLAGANETVISITSKGVLGVKVTTPFAVYEYYLRAKR